MKKIASILIVIAWLLPFGVNAQLSSNQPFPTTIPAGIPAGNALYGAFEGRIPCQEVSKQLHIETTTACWKRKVAIIFYHDAVSQQPTTYTVRGMGRDITGGKWQIVKGTPILPGAIVYQLDFGNERLYLLKGDDNVLFVLDNNKNFLSGNADFSYTLNRVRSKKPGEDWHVLVNKGW